MALVDIWEIVRARAASILTDCEVVRDYWPLNRIEGLDAKTKPLVIVTLDGKMSESLTRTKIKETLQFSVVVMRSLSAGSAAAATARADACLELLPKLQKSFYQKTGTGTEQGLKFLSGTKDGDFFDIEMFTTEDLFFAGTTVYVVYFRDLELEANEQQQQQQQADPSDAAPGTTD